MSDQKYTRESLLRSEIFKGYQKDFLAAILTKPEYTLKAAKKVVADFFGKGEK